MKGISTTNIFSTCLDEKRCSRKGDRESPGRLLTSQAKHAKQLQSSHEVRLELLTLETKNT